MKQARISNILFGLVCSGLGTACGDDGATNETESGSTGTTPGSSASQGPGSDPATEGPVGTDDSTPDESSNGSTTATTPTTEPTATATETEDTATTGGNAAAVCEAFEVLYDECYPEYAREDFCDYFLETLDDPECGSFWVDYLACLTEVECAELFAAEGCAAEFAAGSEACPEAFGTCQDTSNTIDDGCTWNGDLCVDGNTYALACEPNGPTFTCTCQVNGTDAGTFDIDDPLDCYGEELESMTVTVCGFPPNTIPLL